MPTCKRLIRWKKSKIVAFRGKFDAFNFLFFEIIYVFQMKAEDRNIAENVEDIHTQNIFNFHEIMTIFLVE